MHRTKQMSHAPVAFGVNTDGRDLVVGDVHGCFRTLARALDAVGYEAGCDRLFGVGDLVNRGPHSADAVDWLERRFAAVVLGNHDRAVLSWFAAKRLPCRRLGLSGCAASPRANSGDGVRR